MSFQELWNLYPATKNDQPKKIGGHCESSKSQCAIRLSRAIGVYEERKKPKVKSFDSDNYKFGGKSEPVCRADSRIHAKGAEALANHILRQSWKKESYLKAYIFKPPKGGEEARGKEMQRAKDFVTGKKGIVFFKDFWDNPTARSTGTGDHIDLWDGRSGRLGPGTIGDYFLRSKQVWFFEFLKGKAPKPAE